MYHSILFVTVISLTSTYATPSRSILAGNRIVGPMAKNSGFFRSRKILGGSRRLELRAEKKASEKAVDPQKAVEALGEIAGKIQEYTDKSSTWTEEDRAQWKSEYETLVQTIAVPALSFTSANLLTSTGVFFAILSALKYSGDIPSPNPNSTSNPNPNPNPNSNPNPISYPDPNPNPIPNPDPNPN
ncbi:hypothetical protein AAMO2058_001421400 [Amorphochlora amoebiformis]